MIANGFSVLLLHRCRVEVWRTTKTKHHYICIIELVAPTLTMSSLCQHYCTFVAGQRAVQVHESPSPLSFSSTICVPLHCLLISITRSFRMPHAHANRNFNGDRDPSSRDLRSQILQRDPPPPERMWRRKGPYFGRMISMIVHIGRRWHDDRMAPSIVSGMTSSRGFRMLSSGEETMDVDRERPNREILGCVLL
jgi:hypothetical protein